MGVLVEINKRCDEFKDRLSALKEAAREAKRQGPSNLITDEEMESLEMGEADLIKDGDDYYLHRKPNTIDNYVVPPFNPDQPNYEAKGAFTKHKKKYGQYLAFISKVQYFRSSKKCTILALATTSRVFLKLWGSSQLISLRFHDLIDMGLMEVEDPYYQTGICMTYRYYPENEKKLIEHCNKLGIKKYYAPNEQVLTQNQKNRLTKKCADISSADFKSKVIFSSRVKLVKPNTVSNDAFEKYLTECLYENYPGFRLYQRMSDELSKKFYADDEELAINFKPKFTWNDKEDTVIGIGIRASNSLCNATKEEKKKKIRPLRKDVLKKYGLPFEKDVRSSVPKITYGLNFGGWLNDDVDLYKKIWELYEPNEECNEENRDAVKGMFFRAYFDTTDGKMDYHTWSNMVQDGMDQQVVYAEMEKLRRAMEQVLGEKRYGNFIFLAESCIYIDVLHYLLNRGYKVWLVYDCFYGSGFGSQEEFEKAVVAAVQICFMRFKMGYDFGDWEKILS